MMASCKHERLYALVRTDVSGKAIPADLRTGVGDYCPLGRKVARSLLHHFDRRSVDGTATGVITGPTK